MVAERILLMEHPEPQQRVGVSAAASARTRLFFRNVASEERRKSSLMRKSKGWGGSSWRSPLMTSARPLRVRVSGTAKADSGSSTGSGSRDTKRTEMVVALPSAMAGAAALSREQSDPPASRRRAREPMRL